MGYLHILKVDTRRTRESDYDAGFPLSFEAFQEYYSKIPEFASSRYISVVGIVASGLGYLGAPFIMPFIQPYQRWRRRMIWVGCTSLFSLSGISRESLVTAAGPLCIIGLIATSFASTLELLILTQGAA
jgi:hypothetical protein